MKVSRFGTMAVLAGMAVAALAGPAPGADWPQFLGPDRNAMSKETGLARSWPAGGPKVLWTTKAGLGFGGAAIVGKEVFILDRDAGGKQDVLRCLSLDTGKELWSYAYDAKGPFSHDGSRSVPAVDADNVYTVGPLGDLYCISRTTHKPVWNKQLLRAYGGRKPMWVCSQSPLLYKDMVVVAPQGPKAAIVAFNRKDGTVKWQSPAVGTSLCYSSPQKITIGGVDQIAMVVGTGSGRRSGSMVAGVDASNGKLLWTYEGWSCRIAIPTVTDIGDGRLFITGEYRAGSAMIKITHSGTTFKVTELYKTDVCGSQIHQPLLHDGHLYMHSNGNYRNDGMLCLTLDGKLKWKSRRDPNFRADPGRRAHHQHRRRDRRPAPDQARPDGPEDHLEGQHAGRQGNLGPAGVVQRQTGHPRPAPDQMPRRRRKITPSATQGGLRPQPKSLLTQSH